MIMVRTDKVHEMGGEGFSIRTFAEAAPGEWRASYRGRLQRIFGKQQFVLREHKPNIYNALKNFLRTQYHIDIDTLTNASQYGGIRLYMTQSEFQFDRKIRILGENDNP